MAKPPSKEGVVPPIWNTRKWTLTSVDDWVEVGVAPLMLMSLHTIVFALSEAAPDLPPNEGFRLVPGVPQIIPANARVWVSSLRSATDTDVFVAREEQGPV